MCLPLSFSVSEYMGGTGRLSIYGKDSPQRRDVLMMESILHALICVKSTNFIFT